MSPPPPKKNEKKVAREQPGHPAIEVSIHNMNSKDSMNTTYDKSKLLRVSRFHAQCVLSFPMQE